MKYIAKLQAVKNENEEIVGIKAKVLRNTYGRILVSKPELTEFRIISPELLFDPERTRVIVPVSDGTVSPNVAHWHAYVLSAYEISLSAVNSNDETVLIDFNNLDIEIINF